MQLNNMKTNLVQRRLTFNQKKINLLRGGTRSGKTRSLIQMFATWLWEGVIGTSYIPKGQSYIIRQTFPALRMSVYREFIEVLHIMGIYSSIKHMRSTHEFHNKGRVIYFMSADDSEKLKGLDPYLCWLNESNDIGYDTFYQISMRLRHHMYLDYNPSDPDGFIKTKLEDVWLQQRDDMYLDVSTYHDNPFLPQTIIEEIKRLKTLDPQLYEVYSEGNWMKVKGHVYPIWDQIYEPVEGAKQVIGLDFGFNDPTAMIEVLYDKENIWLKEILYETQLTTSDIIEIARPYRRVKIIADSANPNAIEEFRRNGFRKIRPSRKGGKDYLRKGIDRVKQYHIHIHPESFNILREIKRYKWATDRNNEATDKPLDVYNHSMDAVRYAVDYATRRGTAFQIIHNPSRYIEMGLTRY